MEYQFFQIWEYYVGYRLDRVVEHRLVQCLRRNDWKGGIDGIYADYYQPNDQQHLQECEKHSQQLVQPTQHHDFNQTLDYFPEKQEYEIDHQEYQGERQDLEDHSVDIGHGLDPFSDRFGKLESQPGAQYERDQRYCLGDETFTESLHQGRYAADQDYYVDYVHLQSIGKKSGNDYLCAFRMQN